MNMNESAQEVKKTISSVNEVVEPIRQEIEEEQEIELLEEDNDRIDQLMDANKTRNEQLEEKMSKLEGLPKNSSEYYEAKYRIKLEARCHEQLNRGSDRCRYNILTSTSQ